MININVSKVNEDDKQYGFEVNLKDEKSSTGHSVTLQKEFYLSLETQASPKEIVRKSFEFLLKRESKESILSQFDLQLISNFFPEYISEVESF